jgi:hypothetical protein
MLISYTKRETKNLGNYENVSIGIKIEDDIDLEKETAEEGLRRLKKFVTDNMNEEFGRATVKIATNSDLRQKISELINLDANNRGVIKAILAKYGVAKLGELEETASVSFSREIEELIKTNKST